MGVQENGIRKYRRVDSASMDGEEEEEEEENVNIHQQQEKRSERRTSSSTKRFVMACAIFASLNSVLLGYDVGVMSGALIFMQEDLKITEVQQEVLVGILSIVSLLGSLAGGRTSDAIGRKWTMAFAAVVFQSGVGIMAIAPNFEVLMAGRLMAGIGIGFAVMIAPIYIAEISPTDDRGSLTSFPEIFINFGILLGYVSNYVFSGLPVHINWRVMLAVGILPSVFIGVALFLIPESPRWLIMKSRIDEARQVLLKTYGDEKEVEERLTEIQEAASNSTSNPEKDDEKAVWRELLNPSPGVKRMLITGCGIQCFQQITGIDATVYYSPKIFKDAGLGGNSDILAATMAVGFTKTSAILIAIFLIDRVGRKPLLYVSTIGMTTCLLSNGIALTFLHNSSIGIKSVVLFVCGNVIFFSVGLGPICWVLTSEIFPLRLRAQASALGAIGSRLSSGLVAMSFLSVARVITMGGVFFLFSAISALAVLFVYRCVPETKGKSLEQIEMLFHSESRWRGGELELEEQHLVEKQ